MLVPPPVEKSSASLADSYLLVRETTLTRPVEPADRVDLQTLVQKVRREYAGKDEARVTLEHIAYCRELILPRNVAEIVGVNDEPIAKLDALKKKRLAASDHSTQHEARVERQQGLKLLWREETQDYWHLSETRSASLRG